MAYYLVTAKPISERLPDLLERLKGGEIREMRPFGQALDYSLKQARLQDDGTAIWEEEDYCRPPLAQERAAVLDTYFEDLSVTAVSQGEGWQQLQELPKLLDYD